MRRAHRNSRNNVRSLRALCFAICASATSGLMTTPALAQTFEPLFGADLSEWSVENALALNFVLDEGVLQVRGEGGWLRSPRAYGDFILRGEFRFVQANADSGIFLRAGEGTPFILGWPGDSYQVQIRDISENTSDSPLPLVNLYRHRIADGPTEYARERVFALYTGVGNWQSLEVRAQGDSIEVSLNGEVVTRASDIVNASGFLGFQSEAGVIEYRNFQIAEF